MRCAERKCLTKGSERSGVSGGGMQRTRVMFDGSLSNWEKCRGGANESAAAATVTDSGFGDGIQIVGDGLEVGARDDVAAAAAAAE
jgi:hypothetical protein